MTSKPWFMWLVAVVCLGAGVGRTQADTQTVSTLSMDVLLHHAQRAGTTAAKREWRSAATSEMVARGTNTLVYLMDRADVQNVTIFTLSQRLVRDHLSDDEAAAVLLPYLEAENRAIRMQAAFLLSYCETPSYARRLLPLLEDEKTAGTAIRTLGKWQARGQIPEILPFLSAAKERQRVQAVNALHDIGDESTIPALIDTLKDSVFTVRRAAVRALIAMGPAAEKAVLEAVHEADPIAQRELLRVMAERPSSRTERLLRKLSRDDDPGVRLDATLAWEAITGT
ncbi:MAG: HEAT repeat domain-containing protein [Verrucomicrobia bacterium]|nr:HEAT repeat domain-containing protein [Verrucomicrobiota bacterium]